MVKFACCGVACRGRLDDATAELVGFIFDEDMFKDAMKSLDLDPAKLPLGALSQAQIDRGEARARALAFLAARFMLGFWSTFARTTNALVHAILPLPLCVCVCV